MEMLRGMNTSPPHPAFLCETEELRQLLSSGFSSPKEDFSILFEALLSEQALECEPTQKFPSSIKGEVPSPVSWNS